MYKCVDVYARESRRIRLLRSIILLHALAACFLFYNNGSCIEEKPTCSLIQQCGISKIPEGGLQTTTCRPTSPTERPKGRVFNFQQQTTKNVFFQNCFLLTVIKEDTVRIFSNPQTFLAKFISDHNMHMEIDRRQSIRN